MRSILEKAFVALLNEEHDKAEELFHKFMVERARQIHESYRNGDDFDMDECENEIREETHFGEEDLSDLEDDDMHADDHEEDMGMEDDMGGDEHGEDDMDMADDTEMSDDDDDMEMGDESEEGGDERIDRLEDQIEKLTAEFEAMMDAIGDEDHGDTEESEDDLEDAEEMSDGDEDEVEDFGDEVPEDDMEPSEDDSMEEDADMDDMDDLTESIIDELEKVKVSLEDGKEVGDGPKIGQNRGAALPQKNKEARMGGAPVQMKRDDHKGYARETAPATKEMKTRKNTRSTAMAGMDKVSKEGSKAAEINKLSSENGNTKSPLQGTKNVVK